MRTKFLLIVITLIAIFMVFVPAFGQNVLGDSVQNGQSPDPRVDIISPDSGDNALGKSVQASNSTASEKSENGIGESQAKNEVKKFNNRDVEAQKNYEHHNAGVYSPPVKKFAPPPPPKPPKPAAAAKPDPKPSPSPSGHKKVYQTFGGKDGTWGLVSQSYVDGRDKRNKDEIVAQVNKNLAEAEKKIRKDFKSASVTTTQEQPVKVWPVVLTILFIVGVASMIFIGVYSLANDTVVNETKGVI
jgi:hypothetical protein